MSKTILIKAEVPDKFLDEGNIYVVGTHPDFEGERTFRSKIITFRKEGGEMKCKNCKRIVSKDPKMGSICSHPKSPRFGKRITAETEACDKIDLHDGVRKGDG